jgi:hypothetical protein
LPPRDSTRRKAKRHPESRLGDGWRKPWKVASVLDQDLAAYVQSWKVGRNKIIVKGRS